MHNSRREKQILNSIVFAPFVLFVIFVIGGYLVTTSVLKDSDKKWEIATENEYVEKEKAIIKDEMEKIYKFLTDERNLAKKNFENTIKSKTEHAFYFLENSPTPDGVDLLEKENKSILKFLEGMSNFSNKEVYTIYDQKLDVMIKPFNDKVINSYFPRELNKKIIGNEGFVRWVVLGADGNANTRYGYYKYSKLAEKYLMFSMCETNENMLAKKNVLDKIMNFKFPENNYIFVLGFDGVIQGHHKKELIGQKNLKELDYKRWENLNKIVSFAKENGKGFMIYKTGTKENPEVFETKISYVVADLDWEIAMGYGYPVSSINKRIEREKTLKNDIVKKLEENLLIAIIGYLFFSLMASFFIAKNIGRKFIDYKNKLTEEKKNMENIMSHQCHALSVKDKMVDLYIPIITLDNYWNIQYATTKFFQITDSSEKEQLIIGQNILTLLKHNDETESSDMFTKMIAHFNREDIDVYLTPYRIEECLLRTMNEKDLWLTLTISKNMSEHQFGKKEEYIIIAEEVKEQVKLKKQILKEIEKNDLAEKILLQQSKMVAIGETVKMIAHQWKQPLALMNAEIANMIITVRRNKNDGSIKLSFLEDHIERMESSIAFLSNTITDFNAFYEPSDKMEIFNIYQTVKDTLNILIPTVNEKMYEFIFDVDKDLCTYGIRGLYQQIIITIIGNTIEAFINKQINSKRKIKITIKKDETYSYLIFEDNAGGIPQDVLPKIFEAKFSTKNDLGKKTSNSGLGLYLARKVLEDKFNQSDIIAENGKEGAIFTIKTTKSIKLNK